MTHVRLGGHGIDGAVVMVGDSCSIGPKFETYHRLLDGYL